MQVENAECKVQSYRGVHGIEYDYFENAPSLRSSQSVGVPSML